MTSQDCQLSLPTMVETELIDLEPDVGRSEVKPCRTQSLRLVWPQFPLVVSHHAF